jgi:hypothetical protein
VVVVFGDFQGVDVRVLIPDVRSWQF